MKVDHYRYKTVRRTDDERHRPRLFKSHNLQPRKYPLLTNQRVTLFTGHVTKEDIIAQNALRN